MICSENVYKGAWPDMASKGAPRSAICVRRGNGSDERRDGAGRVGAMAIAAAAGVVAAAALLTLPAAEAACEAYPRFTPNSGRTTNEAWEADQFVESIGVNLHLGDGRYVSEFAGTVKPRLAELGVRTVRTSSSAVFYDQDEVRQLGQAGIRFALATGKQTNISRVVAAIKGAGPQYIKFIEGLNEPESRHGCELGQSCWVQPTREHQAELYNAINGDPATQGILVLGPALKGVTLNYAPQMLGNIDALMDAHNMHRYPGANKNPERTGRGGYLDPLAALLQYVGNANKPAFLTETGYSTNAFGTSEAADAVYMPRLFLYNFDHGVAMTSKYQLLDTGASGSSDFEGNFGYIRSNNTPKPSFTAVKTLIGLLADRGSRFRPATLDYRLSGNTANVYKVLMQKRDGTFYLAMWVAKPIQGVTPQVVTLSVPDFINGAAQAKPNDSAVWSSLSLTSGQINVVLDEKVTIVRLGNGTRPAQC